MCEIYAKAARCSFHDFTQFGGKDILIESMLVEKCPVTGGILTLPDRTFLCNTVAVARYDALIRDKFPTNCGAHFAESIFQTRSRRISKLHPVLFVWGGWAPHLPFLLRLRKRWFLLPGWKAVHGFCLHHEAP